MTGAIRQALAVSLLALIPTALAGLFHPKRPGWNGEAMGPDQISGAEVAVWKNAPLWVDARPRRSYERGHIAGALLLNEDEWDELLPAVLSAWQPGRRVVVYCDSAACDSSKKLAERLREAGVPGVCVLHGGWAEWKARTP